MVLKNGQENTVNTTLLKNLKLAEGPVEITSKENGS